MCVHCVYVCECVYVCTCRFCVCAYVYACMFCVCICSFVCAYAVMLFVCICTYVCLCAGVVLCVEVKDHSLSLETRERGLFSKHQITSSHQMWVYTEKSPQILPPSLKRKCFRLARNPELTKWGWEERLPPHWAPRFRWVQLPPKGFPDGSAGRESTCNAGDLGLIPGLGRSPGEGKGYPLQYSGLENSTDCIVHGVTKSQTWLSDFHFTLLFLLGLPPHLPQTFAFFKVFTWNNRLVPNRKRRTSKLYIVTLLI